MRVLDAGCGGGRNIVFLLREAGDVCGADSSPAAIEGGPCARGAIGAVAARGRVPRVEPVERMSFADASADVVLASAVLHFARDDAHFHAMLAECWRVLRPGGLFFARLASTAGIDGQLHSLGDHRFVLRTARRATRGRCASRPPPPRSAASAVDPLKTTLVHGARSMTTWVLRKVHA